MSGNCQGGQKKLLGWEERRRDNHKFCGFFMNLNLDLMKNLKMNKFYDESEPTSANKCSYFAETTQNNFSFEP